MDVEIDEDTVILIGAGGEHFPARRRSLLASSCPVLHSMLKGAMKESREREINLSAISDQGLRQCLFFIVDRPKFNLTPSNVLDVLSAAHFLQFSSLLDVCCGFLSKELTVVNAWETYRLADHYNLDSLLTRAVKFICRNSRTVLKQKDLLGLTKAEMVSFLCSDDIVGSTELELFRAAEKWIEHNPQTRHQEATEVLNNIRFPLIGPDEISGHVLESNVVKSGSPELKKLVDDAIDYHGLDAARKTSVMVKPRSATRSIVMVGGETSLEQQCGTAHQIHVVEGGGLLFADEDSRLPDLPSKVCNHSAAVLNNYLFLAGGLNESFQTVSEVHCYSPLDRAWFKVAPMREKRMAFTLNALGGKLYAVGGEGGFLSARLSSVEVYAPRENRWDRGPALPFPLSNHASCVCGDRLYLSGGQLPYDVQNRSLFLRLLPDLLWESLEIPFPGDMYEHSMAACHGRLYVFGGNRHHGLMQSIDCYDPAADLWTRAGQLPCECSLSAVGVLDGKIFVFGGFDPVHSMQALDQILCFDPSDKSVKNVAQFPHGICNSISGVLLLPP